MGFARGRASPSASSWRALRRARRPLAGAALGLLVDPHYPVSACAAHHSDVPDARLERDVACLAGHQRLARDTAVLPRRAAALTILGTGLAVTELLIMLEEEKGFITKAWGLAAGVRGLLHAVAITVVAIVLPTDTAFPALIAGARVAVVAQFPLFAAAAVLAVASLARWRTCFA